MNKERAVYIVNEIGKIDPESCEYIDRVMKVLTGDEFSCIADSSEVDQVLPVVIDFLNEHLLNESLRFRDVVMANYRDDRESFGLYHEDSPHGQVLRALRMNVEHKLREARGDFFDHGDDFLCVACH